MERSDYAYLAGLLDGEGCIEARPSGPGRWVRACVEVCMTNRAPLNWAHKITGIGSVYAPKERRNNRRQPWKWVISDPQKAAHLLRDVLPFMRVKKAEAMAFVMLASIRKLTPPGGRRPHVKAELMACKIIALAKEAGGL